MKILNGKSFDIKIPLIKDVLLNKVKHKSKTLIPTNQDGD